MSLQEKNIQEDGGSERSTFFITFNTILNGIPKTIKEEFPLQFKKFSKPTCNAIQTGNKNWPFLKAGQSHDNQTYTLQIGFQPLYAIPLPDGHRVMYTCSTVNRPI